MPSITLKNLPDSLLKALKRRAAKRRRSLQQEVVTLLEKGTSGVVSDGEGMAREPTRSYGLTGEGEAEPEAVGRGGDRGAEERRDESVMMGQGCRGNRGAPSGLAEDQLAVWRDLAGKWHAEGSAEAEIAALYSARAGHRDVSL